MTVGVSFMYDAHGLGRTLHVKAVIQGGTFKADQWEKIVSENYVIAIATGR